MFSKVRGSFLLALIAGGVVDFCRRLGLDEATAGYWFLVAWCGTAGLVFVTTLATSVWKKAGQSLHAKKRKRDSMSKGR